MTRKKKTAILFLILLGVALLPLLFLRVWASYRLGEVNSQQTPQGTLISQANTPPEGKNLFEHPLWWDFLKESHALYRYEGGITVGAVPADWAPATNALSRWKDEQAQKMAHYDRFKPEVDKKVVPRPGNIDSTQRELIPTFESLQKEFEIVYAEIPDPGLSPIIRKYQAREDLSDEEKVLAVFQEYFKSGDPATEAEIKKSLAESSFFGFSEEMYTKLCEKEEDFLLYPVNSLASMKTLARYYGYTARLHAYSGHR